MVGTLVSRCRPGASKAAAICFKMAFLAPSTPTVPRSARPPWTLISSIEGDSTDGRGRYRGGGGRWPSGASRDRVRFGSGRVRSGQQDQGNTGSHSSRHLHGPSGGRTRRRECFVPRQPRNWRGVGGRVGGYLRERSLRQRGTPPTPRRKN